MQPRSRGASRGASRALLLPLCFILLSSACVSLTVSSDEDVSGLTKKLAAAGALNVTWVGKLAVKTPITVLSGQTLSIFGAATDSTDADYAVIDGNGASQLFKVIGGTLLLSDVSLTGGSGSYGGAAELLNSTLSATRCRFFENVAAYGGALYAYYSASVTLTSCSFSQNVASSYGGALYAFSASVTLTLCCFSQNVASSYGGALYAYSANATLTSCSFSQNNASMSGGALYAYAASVTLTSCSFSQNNASMSGGAIHSEYYSDFKSISGCNFTENRSTVGAGAIEAITTYITVIDSSRFVSNYGKTGALSIYPISSYLDNSTCYGTRGSSLGRVSDSQFLYNEAVFGGAILFGDCCTLTNLTSVRFEGNSALLGSGGAVVLATLSSIDRIDNCTFVSNQAGFWAGGLYLYNGLVGTIIDSRFYTNSAGIAGGGILLWGGAVLYNLENTEFGDNFLFKLGAEGQDVGARYGAALAGVEGSVENITDCSFYGGYGAGYGGAISLISSNRSLTISATSFVNNSAVSGGAISISGSAIDAISNNCTFSENVAEQNGGAIVNSGNISLISNSIFYGNRAKNGDGGALTNFGNLTLVKNSVFESNSADTGGAVAAILASTPTTFSYSTFKSNTAFGGDGGAVAGRTSLVVLDIAVKLTAGVSSHNSLVLTTVPVSSPVYMTLEYCDFVTNAAANGNGGGISSLYLSDTGSSFTGCSSNAFGGAIWAGTVVLQGSTFADNSAATGGAVYAASNLSFAGLKPSTFTNSTSKGSGGAIFYSGASELVAASALDADFSGSEAQCCFSTTNDTCKDIDGQASADDACCAQGSYKSDTACEPCPSDQGLDCTHLGLTLQTIPMESQWWRADTSKAVGRKCLLPEACVGTTPEGACASGYSGPMCASCAAGYATSWGYRCTQCNPNRKAAMVSLVLLCFLVLLVALVFLFIKLGSFDDGSSAAQTATTVAPQRAPVRMWNLVKTANYGKLRVPVVVLQILWQFSFVTGIQYPPVLGKFLAVVSALSLDFGWALSWSCLFSIDYYGRLLLVTLLPLGFCLALGLSMALALRRVEKVAAGGKLTPTGRPVASDHPAPRSSVSSSFAATRTDDIGEILGQGRDRIVQRHLKVVLVFSFLVYSTTSSAVFQCFACDDVGNAAGQWFLRADYSIVCSPSTPERQFYVAYASLMVLIFPVGIPALYIWLLLHARRAKPDGEEKTEEESREGRLEAAFTTVAVVDEAAEDWERKTEEESKEKGPEEAFTAAAAAEEQQPRSHQRSSLFSGGLNITRHSHAATQFLSKPYRPDVFWWEIAECVRRLLLTGFIVFVSPMSVTQPAVACVLAVLCLAAAAAFTPHADPSDARTYRLGSLIVFLATFVAVLVVSSAAGSDSNGQDSQTLAVLTVTLNVVLLLACAYQCFGQKYRTRRLRKMSAAVKVRIPRLFKRLEARPAPAF